MGTRFKVRHTICSDPVQIRERSQATPKEKATDPDGRLSASRR